MWLNEGKTATLLLQNPPEYDKILKRPIKALFVGLQYLWE